MADLLSSLAARALGELDSVRPRVVSAFERPAIATGSGWVDALEVELPVEPVTRPSAAQPARPVPDDPAAPPLDVSTPRAPLPGPPPPVEPVIARKTVPIETAAPVVTTDVAESERHAPIARPARPEPPARERRPAAAVGPVPAREPIPQIVPTPAEAEPRAPQPAIRETVVLIDRRPTERPSPDAPRDRTRDVAGPATEPATPRILARPVPAREPGLIPVARREPAPAPPVIVTIGRVEVSLSRPTEPPRPIPRPASPQPAMSLGEYLERSRRGRP
ncbi:MAG TPA: hypothetical protein PKA95_09590 [Thermomicrobiales bacterium]|nr:hypothetical protein [Thermomicrobiales bacterium]